MQALARMLAAEPHSCNIWWPMSACIFRKRPCEVESLLFGPHKICSYVRISIRKCSKSGALIREGGGGGGGLLYHYHGERSRGFALQIHDKSNLSWKKYL